jgi:hypothetical protein
MRNLIVLAALGLVSMLAVAQQPVYLLALRQDGSIARARIADGSPQYAMQLMSEGLGSDAVAIDLEYHEGGYYILDLDGNLHLYGKAWYSLEGVARYLDQASARNLEFIGQGPKAMIVNNSGEGYDIMPEGKVTVWVRAQSHVWFPIRDLEIHEGAPILLDSMGSLYREDMSIPFLSFPIERGDEGQDLEIGSNGDYYLLTAQGKVYYCTDEKNISTLSSGFFGGDIARSLALTKDSGGYWILDDFGGITSYGNAQNVKSMMTISSGWIDLEAVYPEDQWNGKSLQPQMSVSLTPTHTKLSTWQKKHSLAVHIERAWDLANFKLLLSYDPSVLSPDLGSARAGEFFARVDTGVRMRCSMIASGSLEIHSLALVGEGHGTTGKGELVSLDFDILSDGPMRTSIEIESFQAIDSQRGALYIDAATRNGADLQVVYNEPGIMLSLAPMQRLGKREVQSGDLFPVYVLARDWQKLTGFELQLNYWGYVFVDLGYMEGDFLLDAGTVSTALGVASDAIAEHRRRGQRMQLIEPGQSATGSGLLLTYWYRATHTGLGKIRLSESVMYNEAGERVHPSLRMDEVLIEVKERK